MQLESIILALIIDANEGGNVAITDAVRAYLLASMKDYMLVKVT